MSSPCQPASSALVDVASRFDLCFGWHIVAADEEESGVHKYKLPDRSFRHRSVGRVSRDGTTLRQNLGVRLDVRSESDFDDVMNSSGAKARIRFAKFSPVSKTSSAPARDAIPLSLSARHVAMTRAPA